MIHTCSEQSHDYHINDRVVQIHGRDHRQRRFLVILSFSEVVARSHKTAL